MSGKRTYRQGDRRDNRHDRRTSAVGRDKRHSRQDGRYTFSQSRSARRDNRFGDDRRDDRRRDNRRLDQYDRRDDDRRRQSFEPGGHEHEQRERSSELIFGRNPVTEALKSGRAIERVMVQETSGGSVGRVISLAKERGIPVIQVTRSWLSQQADGAAHQGVAAQVSAHTYASLEDVLKLAEDRGEDPFIIVLDGIEDPHNLGAIMRSAECAGAHGVVIPKRRAVGLTQTVAKASAGAIEYLPCVKVTNIARTLEGLKEQGIWVYACDMDGVIYTRQGLTGPVAIVVGSEGDGISENVKKKCDGVVSIPLHGHINSLNASNAASILMYEIRRQRDAETD